MSGGQPLQNLWWLISRASGVLALILVSAAVLLGLALAGRSVRRPGLRRVSSSLHEHLAVIAVIAICLHGLALLGDHWMKPGIPGIAVPFVLTYRPGFTGVGIIGGYMVMLLGPSFYLRRRIGARRWRKLHPLMLVAWLLALVHTLGAGSDGQQLWLRAIVLTPVVPAAYLLVVRLGTRKGRPKLVQAAPATGPATRALSYEARPVRAAR